MRAVGGSWRDRVARALFGNPDGPRADPPDPSDSWVGRPLTMADYLSLPSVARARDLTVSTIAQLEPVAYRGGVAMDPQPSVVTRPAPGLTRTEWLAQLAGELFDHGNAIAWLPVSGRNAEGWPDVAIVVPFDEVTVAWADPAAPFVRQYDWGGRILPARDVLHVALRRGPGELVGRSLFDLCADALDRIIGTELYAADYFDSGAVPDTVLRYGGELTADEAIAAKGQWTANHRDRSPAVVGGGWDVTTTGADPESSQLLESRQRGDLEVARLMGIVPGELLLTPASSSSIVYQNVAGMLDTFVRVTVQPLYLSPIEDALSDLLPRTQVVRFSLDELFRLGEAQRIPVEVQAIDAGIYTLDEVRAGHGKPPTSSPAIPPALQPTPSPLGEVPTYG